MATKSRKGGSSRTPGNKGSQKGGKKGGGKASPKPLPVTAKKKSTWSPFSWGLPTGFADMSGSDKVVWVCLHLLVILVPIAIIVYVWRAARRRGA